MRHLRHAAVELDPPADDALGADRQQPGELVALHIEINEGQGPGVVGADHPVRASPETGLVRFDAYGERCNTVGFERPDSWRGPPVDDTARQVPQQIDDERSGKALEQLGRLRANAWERGHRRKQLVEDGGTHSASLYPREG